MKKLIILNKKLGQTPLEAIDNFKKKNKKYTNTKMGYAGRLDPMASGALLILIGDENKKINKYIKLDKTYKAKILLGLSTDTYDILGIAKKTIQTKKTAKFDIKKIKTGKQIQELPIFSSYRINGKPLFWYALNNKPVKLPKTKIEIKSIKLNRTHKISSDKLLKQINSKINKVKGNFRQEKIKTNWKKLLKKKEEFYLISLTISCSSGTYIRSIANKLGGVLFDLKRIRVGRFYIPK